MYFTGRLLLTYIHFDGSPIRQSMRYFDSASQLTFSDLAAVTPFLAADSAQVKAAIGRDFKDNERLRTLLRDLRSCPKHDGTGASEDRRVLIQIF